MRITPHRRTIKSIGALVSGNLSSSLLGAVGGLLIARFVSPEINGQYRLFTIPLMYLSFLHLGTFDGLNRQIPFYIGRDQTDHVERIASTVGAWNFFVTCVVALGFLSFAAWRFLLGNNSDAAGWLSQALICIGIFYGGYLGTTYRTLNNFVVFARIQLVHSIIGFCLVFTVAFLGFYGLCLRAAISALIATWLYHLYRPMRIHHRFDIVAFKEVVKVGMPLCFWGTIYTSIWLATEYSLMLHYGGVKSVGLFAIAVIMRESLAILPHSVNQVLIPRLIESYARDGEFGNDAKRMFLVSGVLFCIMAVIVPIVSALLNYCVPLLIPKYVDGLPLMKACLWLAVIHAVSLPLNGLVATGRSWLYGKGILAGFITFPLAVYLLNPLIGGILAVATGSLLGRLIRTIVAYFDLLALIRQKDC